MDLFLRVDINIMAVILLSIIFFIAFHRLDRKDVLNRVFLKVSLIIILELLLETTTCIINRHNEKWLIPVSIVIHICLFSISPILTYYWYELIKNLVVKEQEAVKGGNKLFFLPVIVSIVVTVVSPVFHLVFYITDNNVYHRGPLFIPVEMTIYFYVILSCLLIMKNRNKLIKEDFIVLFTANIFPLIGGVIQLFFYGPLLMLSSTAFSLMITYNFLQQRMVQLDSLTGAWNRGSFDYYIEQRLKCNSNDIIGIIYCDLDKLKYINDNYGHMEGDAALKTSISIIKDIIMKNEIIVRMGGDEFIIITDYKTKQELDLVVDKLREAFVEYNYQSNKSYKIECSFGADVFCSDYSSIQQFLNHVDNLMYENKRLKYVR
jgi:diguanylate cyclase (GGDEF) domain